MALLHRFPNAEYVFIASAEIPYQHRNVFPTVRKMFTDQHFDVLQELSELLFDDLLTRFDFDDPVLKAYFGSCLEFL